MKNKKKIVLKGIPASTGIVKGKIYKYYDHEVVPYKILLDSEEKVQKEINLFINTLSELKDNLNSVIQNVDQVSAQILEVHLSILDDPVLLDEVKSLIQKERYNAAWAFYYVMNKYIGDLEGVEDLLIQERIIDLKDVRKSVLNKLLNKSNKQILGDKDLVIVSKELTPSDMVHLATHTVIGFVDEEGGITSHSVIMARALNLPGVTGVKNILSFVETGDEIIVDGLNGIVIVNPDEEDIDYYNDVKKFFVGLEEEFRTIIEKPAVTPDGKRINLLANIEIPIEVESAISYGAEGIGLFRTEFMLFLKNQILTLDEQKHIYEYLLDRMRGKVLTIRLFDIGGDKNLPGFLGYSDKYNSFMGLRAIRILLKANSLFKTQVKAIFRSLKDDTLVRILIPFITDMWEVEESLKLIEEVKTELRQEGYNIDFSKVKLGIMVEVPSVAFMLNDYLKSFKEIDFISIGTNDLLQFLLAVDRGNDKVNNLYNPYHPVLLRVINDIVNTAHYFGKRVEVCGEIANSQTISVLLLGMGVDELSMAPFYLPYVKRMIRNVSFEYARKLLKEALLINNSEKLEDFVKNELQPYTIRELVNKRRKYEKG